ncbi:hypothetical protein [Vibrio parahaemolyticus]|uniref:hypothetical protein n=1 Tax=Vibrio parahaemolyticus TaxID=670 RepID=UPI00235EFF80|nr:hypothetical protein [Vibrio parahaemolyticus]
MQIDITKIQILPTRTSNNPIFYCHTEDLGHIPVLSVVVDGDKIKLLSHSLFKVKGRNPQFKDRVDIYMSVDSATELARYLLSIVNYNSYWPESKSNPNANKKGNMELPEILFSSIGKAQLCRAKTDSGVVLIKQSPSVYVEYERPAKSHIKMKNIEVHIGVPFNNHSGVHEESLTWPVEVPESEFQKGANEKNPIFKVMGTFMLEMDKKASSEMANAILKGAEKIKAMI